MNNMRKFIKNMRKFIKNMCTFLVLIITFMIMLHIFQFFIPASEDGTVDLRGFPSLSILTILTIETLYLRNEKVRRYIKKFFSRLFSKIRNVSLDTSSNEVEIEEEIKEETNNLNNDSILFQQNIVNKLKDEEKELQTKIRQLRSELEALRKDVTVIQNQKIMLDKQIKDKKHELGLLTPDNSEYIQELLEQNKSSMELELENLRHQISEQYDLLNKVSDQNDSLKKLEELLDLGILTQEEFDKKKKELLNL